MFMVLLRLLQSCFERHCSAAHGEQCEGVVPGPDGWWSWAQLACKLAASVSRLSEDVTGLTDDSGLRSTQRVARSAIFERPLGLDLATTPLDLQWEVASIRREEAGRGAGTRGERF
ncbi:hypothetical protein [Pseudarthrobacter sp. S9]|uniref:hypothetical protein n=1 Tax=Pseudarthrobacter sp. S9 TaxID=3418421 RepID=UPI003D08FDDC